MRRLGLLVLLSSCAIALTPPAAADVIVRTCDTPTFCHEVARIPAPSTCHVDYLKAGLGRPGSVRSDCVAA